MGRENSTSNASLRSQLRDLNRLDPDQVDFQELQATYSSLLDGTHLVVGLTSGAELFFRVRVNPPTKPEKTADLGAPPTHLVTGFQRCNEPGKPTLYTSSKRLTALKECRVKSGDRVYITQWIGHGKIPINRLLENEEDSGFERIVSDRDEVIHAHIDAIFARRIHSDFSNDYKFSAAIANVLTTNFNENTEHDIRSDRTIGLRYPSILDRRGSYNTAFHAAFADERLSPMHCIEATVGESDGSQMPLKILDTALEFEEGNIRWTGNPYSVPVLRSADGGVLFRFTGKKWLPEVRTGGMTKGELTALLCE